MMTKIQTPLQYKKIILLGMILIANNASMWMIFSFLPSMVQFYYPMIPENEYGYKSGMLGAAYSAGGLIGNVLWGSASDRYGRRPVLLYGLLGTAFSAILFGFAPSYPLAVLSRFIWGLLNGNIGISKTYLGEISDDTNSARGMALYAVIGGSGRFFGPLLGGLLYDPAKNYPSIFGETFFQSFPFALPALIVAIYCFLLFPLVIAFLPETLPQTKAEENNNFEVTKSIWILKWLSTCGIRKFTSGSNQPLSVSIYDLSVAPYCPSVRAYLRQFCCFCAKKSSLPDLMRAETVTTVTSSSDQRFSLTYQPLSTVEPQSPQSAHQSDRTIMSPSDSRCEEDATMNGLELGFVGNKSVYSPTDRDESAEGAKGSGLVRLEGSSQDSTSSAVSSDSTLSSSSSSRRRKVSFLNQVTVKIIDEPGLSRSPLKQISLDDIPVKTICRPFGAIDIMVEAKQQFMEQGGIDVHSITSDEKEDQLELLVYSNGAEFSNEAAGSKSTATLTSLLITVLRRKEILLCVSLYGLGAFCVTLSAELFPLWAVTDARDSGLGYGPQAIGLSTGICGLGSVFLQLVVYPRLAESLGVVRMFRLGATLFSMSSFFLPSSVPLASFFFFWAGNVWPARCFALLLQMLCVVTANWILISVFVLINNSCYSHQRATVNGIGQTFASFGRLIGPLLGAPLFAWSEGNNLPWPLNFCLTWNVLSLLALVTAQLSYLLPRTIERQKREPRPSRQVESEFAARLSAEAESRPALHSLPNPIVFPDWTAVKSSDDEMDPSPIEVTAANFEVSPLSDAESAIGLRGDSEQNSISLRNLLRRSKPLFSD